MLKNLPIAAKINLSIFLIFIAVLIASVLHTFSSERELIENIAREQSKNTADTYFDALNTMMLTGTMAQRNLLNSKMKEHPGITDVRVIRGHAVTALYGEGLPEEQIKDKLDERALAGEPISEINIINGERILTVVNPVHVSNNFRGTDCMTCHANAKLNDVVGAVRISYSLKELDAAVQQNLFESIIMHVVLFGLGLLLMAFILRNSVCKPLHALRRSIEIVDQDADLNQQVEIYPGSGEIAQVGTAFNHMLKKIHGSLNQVLNASQQLTSLASDLTAISEETVSNVTAQQGETDQAATAINEIMATTQEIAHNANETATTSQEANLNARKGALTSTEAIGSIDLLVNELHEAAEKIQALDSETENIGMILDVITKISEQTNLLALNAAIEAARAGEQGRGFAVVADEVRTLAARSQESASQIQGMVESLQAGARNAVEAMNVATKQAEDSSEKVEESAESLAMIAGEIAEISERNTQIATAAEQQSSVMEESNQNLVNITESTHRTAAVAEQTAEYSEQLLQLAQQLETQVGHFKI
ncbi:MAG: methyl-accepting chemotaxis protein [Gammaproteobacteria bacterium]|nr:methyl-accepting chemotaxis protein [Gammaproteobacteria bacterium]